MGIRLAFSNIDSNSNYISHYYSNMFAVTVLFVKIINIHSV